MIEDRTTPEELALCKCEDCPFKMEANPKLKEVYDKVGIRLPIGPILGEFVGDPNTPYKIVVVGIGIGDVELKTGSPFTGTSGGIAKKTMNQVGYTGYYITNTFLCQVPPDTTENETLKAMYCCSNRLNAEILRHKPDLIITMGAIPMQALIENPGKVTKMAGRVHTGELGPTLVTLHPASFQKGKSDMFGDFVDQVSEGLRYLEGSYQQVTAPTIVIADENNFSELLNKLDKYPEMVLDLETTRNGLFPYGTPPDGIRCLVLAVDPTTAYVFPGESSPYYDPHPNFVERQELKNFLKGKNLITHNGQFDIAFLLQSGYTELNLYYDTLLAHVQMDERLGVHGLKYLAKKYLGANDWESDIKVFFQSKTKRSYDLVPDSRLYVYAGMDVVCTWLLYQRFKTEVNSGIFKDLIMPCSNMFAEIRHKGFRVDTKVIMSLDEILDKEYEEEIENLTSLAGYYINPKSPPDVATYVYDVLKCPVMNKFGRATGAKVLDYYKEYLEVQSILRCRAVSKLQSTYVRGLAEFVDDNFRIHPFTKLYGAVTGRISTEDPSVMNITKKRGGGIKKIYIPEKDHYLVEADQKQMELRCYCVIAHDEKLTKLLTESKTDKSKDPHRMVASIAFGAERSDEMRGAAKTAVFGRLYGRGIDSFVHGLKITREDAQNLINIIDNMFPGVKFYNTQVKKEIKEQGYLESYFGRRRRFPLLTPENQSDLFRQGTNFKVQSMASDVNLYCMLHLYGMRNKLGAFPMFPVHDSILFDVVDIAVIPTLKKEMERFSMDISGNQIEFVEEVKYGRNWGEVKEWKE